MMTEKHTVMCFFFLFLCRVFFFLIFSLGGELLKNHQNKQTKKNNPKMSTASTSDDLILFHNCP